MSQLYGHFFKIESMNNGNQTIILVSDYHYSNDSHNQDAIAIQQKDILTLAQELNALVIVEDGYMNNWEQIIHDTTALVSPSIIPYGQLDASIIQTPLHGLHSLCIYNKITSINVETRFSAERTIDNFFQYLAHKKQIILGYNDPEQYKQLYQDFFSKLEKNIEQPCKKIFDYIRVKYPYISQIKLCKKLHEQESVLYNALMTQASESDMYFHMSLQEKIGTLYTRYGCVYLDMDIMHAIAQHPDKQCIIICAGDYHIEHCMNLLKTVGYLPIKKNRGYYYSKW